jgi:D-glycero-D-manno-heptose 1,7-bisphosphate phosphatase
MVRAVFLDRDGVLNKNFVRDGVPHPPKNLLEFEMLPNVPEAVTHLKDAGFLLVVVTNQPDVARGTQSISVIHEMHEALRREINVDEIYICIHDGDGCVCRKPKPGMLLSAAKTHNIDLKNSFMVGDRWKDIVAGSTAGCKTVLVGSLDEGKMPIAPDAVFTDLFASINWIIQQPTY